MKLKVTLVAIIVFSLLGMLSNAQNKTYSKEFGLPFVTKYTPDLYDADAQNWGTVKDSLGNMYFANGDGVLIYNGVTWELVVLPNNDYVRTIAIDKQGKVYVGSSGEFGYLVHDKFGKFDYISLVPKLEERYKNFSSVFETIVTDQGVYFRTREYLFRWSGEKFKIWEIQGEKFRSISYVNNTLYTSIKGKGLMSLKKDKLQLVKGGEQFSENYIHFILPYNDNLLIATPNNGLFLFKNGRKNNFQTSVDKALVKNILYTGKLLSNETYILGTISGGIMVINKRGKLLLTMDNSELLSSIRINNLFIEKSGIIWACTGNGISKIEYPSPFSRFNKINGINSMINFVESFKNKVYVGTLKGLFVLDKQSTDSIPQFNLISIKNRQFKENPNMQQILNMVIHDDIILIACTLGIYQIKNNIVSKIAIDDDIFPIKIFNSKIDKNRVFIGISNGLMSIYYKNGSWIDEGKVDGISGGIYRMAEMKNGDLWLKTDKSFVWRVHFKNTNDAKILKNPFCTKYGQKEGLPNDSGQLKKFLNEIYFVANNLRYSYRFNEQIEKFELATNLNQILNIKSEILSIEEVDEQNNIFFSTSAIDTDEQRYVGWNRNGKFYVENLHQDRIIDEVDGMYIEHYDVSDSSLWSSGGKSLIKHNLSKPPLKIESFNTTINKVIYQADSTLISGPYHTATATLPFKNNSFRFQYASPFFCEEAKNQFQHILEGFDNTWSSWSKETKKDYTNLPEGTYTFRVRAKNIFGNISKEDRYIFTILAPWYRTRWAYLTYLLMAVFTIWLFAKWQNKRLAIKNLALERMVDDRTTQVKEKNKQLQKQTQQLQSQTKRLKELDTMKTRLFANISHEFRTPLTLIKGPIEKLEQTKKNTLSTTNIKMIRRNANRLLNLVNQLLDLSKIDSGKLELNPAEGDIFKCFRAVASSFSSHAAQRDIDYQIKIPPHSLWVSFDRDKIEKICYNLLSNAFKFTSDHGKIIFKISYRSNRIQILVSDTGQGIEQEKIPHIFDRFYQVDDSYTKEKAGSGIGLSLAKELVDLLKGEIYVESELNVGSIFKVVFYIEEIKTRKNEIDEQEYIQISENLIEYQPTVLQKQPEKNHTVLLVEDNIDMRHFIKEQLVLNYNIIEAFNGKQGLKKAKELIPDLIITDLMMPQMDGITLCKTLKTDVVTSHIPIVMLTAKAGIENKLEGLETGADDYLVKPFHTRELQVRVKNLITEREKLRELFSTKPSIHPKEVTVNSIDQEFLEKTLELLEEFYTNPEFGISQMQQQLGMSKTQLHCKLKALTNQPPGELLRNFRLKRAAQLLIKDSGNISQIAYDVGFNSLSYFTKCFKKYYKMAPSEYIQKNT